MIYTLKKLWWFVLSGVLARFIARYQSKSSDLRSDSDHAGYLTAVKEFVEAPAKFESFKRDPRYNEILEHVSFHQGEAYLNILRARNDGVFQMVKASKILERDNVGMPFKFKYPGEESLLSPTTLRYVKVASDLRKLFGSCSGTTIEIGCGYGGQCVVSDHVLEYSHYLLVDLLPVCNLIELYLESQLLRNSYKTLSLNKVRHQNFDLVVSNYAFSEMPRVLQSAFIEKILLRSSRGYLTMNSGYGSGVRADRYQLEELKIILPGCEVFKELPQTNPNNYIIAWGHSKIEADLGLEKNEYL